MESAGVTFRTFTPDDQQAVRALILAGLADHFGQIDETRNPDLDDIAANYAPPNCHMLIAELDGQLAGTGVLRRLDASSGELVRVSIRRDLRGRGLGRALVERLIAMARAWGLSRLIVETNNDWYDAIGLYRRCGFVPYAEDAESVYLARECAPQ